jgi:adenylate cyclase
VDFAAEGFFDGLEGAALEERRALLEWLVSEGFTPDELRRADRRGSLVLLPAQRLLYGVPRYTMREVAERSGAELDLMKAFYRAHGLPVADDDAAEYSELDVAGGQTAMGFAAVGMSNEQMIVTTRVIGRSLAAIAETMREVALENMLTPGTTELDLARGYALQAETALPLVGPLLEQALVLHLRHALESEVGIAERLSGQMPGARDQAVAFADLVGFTRLGEEIPPEDLTRVAERLFVIARDVVEPPVRLVKTIGDAVMLVAPEPEPLVRAALRIVDASDAESGDGRFPQVRVGLAYGPTVARSGDVFGRAVNLASRVTTIARAGSVLATREVRDASRDRFAWSSAHARRIKGLPEPVPLYRARPLAAEGL